jgi:hypothetical protein
MLYVGAMIIGAVISLAGFSILKDGGISVVNLLILIGCELLWTPICFSIPKSK